ncbi:hypothetical protein GDO86_000072 [Hymenochirus boettgeri]|uniref:Progonadoliberin n=1 Tax=Hymenochirus boettgeri TaxID=247094 RepID=A0A8T2KAK0_9PIPI|nr:hypothetical protein GDO86_000072 [Hymenochirus boettgeri]
MASQSHFVLLLIVLFAVSMQFTNGQHWSHGWYPGGKRELDMAGSSEISEEIKLCEGGECAYLRNPRKGLLKSILNDLLTRQIQRK